MKRNLGFSLLEITCALVVLSMIMLVLVPLWLRGQTGIEQAHVAHHLRKINNATERYVILQGGKARWMRS